MYWTAHGDQERDIWKLPYYIIREKEAINKSIDRIAEDLLRGWFVHREKPKELNSNLGPWFSEHHRQEGLWRGREYMGWKTLHKKPKKKKTEKEEKNMTRFPGPICLAALWLPQDNPPPFFAPYHESPDPLNSHSLLLLFGSQWKQKKCNANQMSRALKTEIDRTLCFSCAFIRAKKTEMRSLDSAIRKGSRCK